MRKKCEGSEHMERIANEIIMGHNNNGHPLSSHNKEGKEEERERERENEEAGEGEGIVLRQRGSFYVHGRNPFLIKFKVLLLLIICYSNDCFNNIIS